MESLLRVLDHTADGACVIDDQQRIIYWNEAAETLLGHAADEVIGRSCYQVFGARAEGGCAICRRECVPFTAGGRGELVPNFDARVRTKTGQTRWVNVSVIAMPASDETSQIVIHLFRDIDDKKQAETFAMEIASRAQRLKLPSPTPMAMAGNESNSNKLTLRELQVLDLLARGVDTTTIATELIISEATVRNHTQRILHKLGVHSRLEAVAYAREHGLIG